MVVIDPVSFFRSCRANPRWDGNLHQDKGAWHSLSFHSLAEFIPLVSQLSLALNKKISTLPWPWTYQSNLAAPLVMIDFARCAKDCSVAGGPREGKCLKRLHHNIQNLQASARHGCHLCSLILGSMDKTLLGKLNEECLVSSGSYARCLCVTVRLGDRFRLQVFRSQFRMQRLVSLLHASVTLEAGEEYDMTQVIHIPRFNVDLPVLDSKPGPDRTFVSGMRSNSTLHDASLALISKWIQDCCRFHPLCRHGQARDQRIGP